MNKFITETGFQRPTFSELLTELGDSAKLIFGEDIAIDDKSVFGKILRLIAYNTARFYEDLETAYYARFPHTATGVSLDRQCVFAGIKRNVAIASRHTVTFHGTRGYTIPVGFEVSTRSGVNFVTESESIIGESGEVSVVVMCTENGIIGNVSDGSIEVINAPDSDILFVDSSRLLSRGEEEEKDIELRNRFDEAILGLGSGTVDAIKGAVMRCANVRGCIVVENNTNETVDGLAPHSFVCYVSAPEASYSEIAQAIFDKKPIGILSCGDTPVEVVDEAGGRHEISFSKVQNQPIYIKAVVSVQDCGDDLQKEIKKALSDKINKLSNGDDVILSSLYVPIYAIEGVKDVTSIQLSTDGNVYRAENIGVAVNMIAFSDEANISVEVNDYVDN
ncbi:MAG: baseplate J/gp47 family protein [Ruminococcus sp.]|nr:baseplate J/gp47 family protein [Ruminococcus sp.]